MLAFWVENYNYITFSQSKDKKGYSASPVYSHWNFYWKERAAATLFFCLDVRLNEKPAFIPNFKSQIFPMLPMLKVHPRVSLTDSQLYSQCLI